MLRAAQHDKNVGVYPSRSFLSSSDAPWPHQDSSVQNEEAVGLEPYILYDPTFRTVVGLNPLLFFIQKRIDGFLNSSLNLFTLNGILDLFTQSSRHIKHVDHLI